MVTVSGKIGRARISAGELKRFGAQVQRAARLRGEVSVLLTSAKEIRELNRCFRGIDRATDVLSFPAADPGMAGDIAISIDAAREQARAHRYSVADEMKILMLHGMLHLAGMDHERDRGEMRREEERLRRKLGLPASLISRLARSGA